MKMALLRNVLVGLIIFLSGVGVVQAQNSAAFPVSCTIPAIPGVNAPPLQAEQKQEINIAENNAETADYIIQEETMSDTKSGQILIVKTVYGK